MQIEILHPFSVRAGFALRLEKLVAELSRDHIVQWHQCWWSVLALLTKRHKPGTIAVCYTSLLAPIMVLLHILSPGIRLRYMVRGDEATEAEYAGRPLRRRLALILQAALARFGVRFVFASWDLLALFKSRFRLRDPRVLPNTIGRNCGPFRTFDGRIAIVGEFGTVKNVEATLRELKNGPWTVHLFGASSAPAAYVWPGLVQHGYVHNLRSELENTATIVVLGSLSEGFPNVLVDAICAGCGVLTADDFPFAQLPLSELWKFSRRPGALRNVIAQLEYRRADFGAENTDLLTWMETDWLVLAQDALL